MRGTLLIALFIAGSAAASAETICMRVHRIPLLLNKPRLKVRSRKGPLFGHLIGRSKSEVRRCQGEPASETPDAWTYHERLGPGAHSFQHSWVVKFKQDKVVEVEVSRVGVGCILILPPEGRPSKP